MHSLATTEPNCSAASEQRAHQSQLYLSQGRTGKQQAASVAVAIDSKTTEDTFEQQQHSAFSTNDLLKLTSDLKLTDDHLCASGTDQQLLSTNRMLITTTTATNEHQENEQQKVETLTDANEQQQHFINNNNYVDQHYFQHYDHHHHHHQLQLHHLPRFHHQVVGSTASTTSGGHQFTPIINQPDQYTQQQQQQQQQQTFLNDPMDFLELASFPQGHAFAVSDEVCPNYCHSGQPEVLRVEHRNRQQHMSNHHFYPQTDSGHASSANSSTGNATLHCNNTGSLLSLTATRHAHSAAGLLPTPAPDGSNSYGQCLEEPIDASVVGGNSSAGNLTTTTTATTTIIPSMSSTASCPLNVTATTTSCFSNADHELIVTTGNNSSYSAAEPSELSANNSHYHHHLHHHHHHLHHQHQLQVEPELKVCEWEGCGNTFLDMLAFVKHLEERHVNQVPKIKNRYYCLWANCKRNEQEFNARYKLLIHMRVHSGEKPYPCNNINCKKSFSRLENLKIHVRSHTGEKPYKCSYETCSKSFTNSSDRIKHHKTHKDPKPYSCNFNGCPKRYTDPSSLRKHLRAHKKAQLHPATTTTSTTVTCATSTNTQNFHLSADFDPSALLLLPPPPTSSSAVTATDEQQATSSQLANNFQLTTSDLSHSQLSRSWCVGHQHQAAVAAATPTSQLTWPVEAHEVLNRSLPAAPVQWRSESFLASAADLSRAAYEP